MKLGPPLFEKEGTQTCDHTPHYAKVYKRFIVLSFRHRHLFCLNVSTHLLIVGYRRSKDYKPREHTDPTNLIFHESLVDIVYANEAYGDGSIVILTTQRLLKLLLHSTGVHIDGTFKITPKIFYNQQLKGQALGMHVIYGGASAY